MYMNETSYAFILVSRYAYTKQQLIKSNWIHSINKIQTYRYTSITVDTMSVQARAARNNVIITRK